MWEREVGYKIWDMNIARWMRSFGRTRVVREINRIERDKQEAEIKLKANNQMNET